MNESATKDGPTCTLPDCRAPQCVAARRRAAEARGADVRTPPVEPKTCGCEAGDLRARLEAAFPDATVTVTEPIALDLRAERAARRLTDAVRDVRRLLTPAGLQDLGLAGEPLDGLADAARVQVEDGLTDALPGLLKAAGALLLLGRTRTADAVAEALGGPGGRR